MASLSSLVIDENDQNAVNEATAPMLTMAHFLLLWRALKALRNMLKPFQRKVDSSDDEAVDKMALDAYKAAGRYARQLARLTQSKPVYPHILQFIVPRLVKQNSARCHLVRVHASARARRDAQEGPRAHKQAWQEDAL